MPAQTGLAIPTKGLQGYWPFNGNANDVSGNNRHGNVFGATLTKDRFGNENNAYEFDGIKDYILTNYPGIMGNNPRAISFWANLSDTLIPSTIVSWGANEQFPMLGGRFDCGFNQGRTGVTVGVSDAFITFEAQDPVYDGRWHHYVIQFNKTFLSEIEIYQDGAILTHEPARSYTHTKIFTRQDKNVMFGWVDEIGKNYPRFKGMTDDVAIYDRVLSLGEIKALRDAPDPVKKHNIKKWLVLFLAIIAIILLIICIIRFSVRKLIAREKEKTRLKNQWYEQENRILQAQMDPHFIFNSLNSIQQFIIAEDNEKAQVYLSKFSRLVRMLLESNTDEMVSLKDEKELTEKYLEIESLRFNNIFDYEIIFKGDLNLEHTYIPRFLVQPFVENAIWHGLLPKTGYKELDITFERVDEWVMRCTIEDNGIGRKNSTGSIKSEMQGKTKRLGIGFVQQRLLNMSKIDGREYSVTISDKEDAEGHSTGTRVVIEMPITRQD